MIVSCSKGVCCLVRVILSHQGRVPPLLGAPHSPPGLWCRGISDTSYPRAADEVPSTPLLVRLLAVRAAYSAAQRLEMGQNEGPAGCGWDAQSQQMVTVQPYVF